LKLNYLIKILIGLNARIGKDILKKENKLKKVRGAGVYKSIWNPYISSIKGDIL